MQDDSAFGSCLDLVRDLRRRCDWDHAQTRETLRPYLREEVAELDEALAADDEARIAAELGDLLLHLCFQLVIAEERGSFTLGDVADALGTKMRRRHPHLFAGEPKPEWEKVKAAERHRPPARRVAGGCGRRHDRCADRKASAWSTAANTCRAESSSRHWLKLSTWFWQPTFSQGMHARGFCTTHTLARF